MTSWDESRREENTYPGVDEDHLDEENYYSMLNVSKDASNKEITQAYHRLGLIYHPDKLNNVTDKHQALTLFYRIKKAYDVLIDPKKRAIYDSVGVKGLENEDLQLVVRSKSPQEIREEYERLSKEREENLKEKLTHSQGYFSMKIDSTDIFENVPSIDKNTERSLLKIGDLNMEQTVSLSLSDKNSISLTGSVGTVEKYGNGSASAGLRHLYSPDTFFDFRATLGSRRNFYVSNFHRFTSKCNNLLGAEFIYKDGSLKPILTNTINYQLDTNLMGQFTYKTFIGYNSSMSTALIYNKDNYNFIVKCHLSLKNTYIGINLNREFKQLDFKLNTYLQYGFLGATFSYGIEKQITKYSQLNASIVANSMAGVILNLQITRGPQTFIAPIHLSHEIVPSAIFYGTLAPLAVFYVVKKLIVDPYVKDKEETDAKRKQEKLKTEIVERKRTALAAQELMKETVFRILEKEGSNGLIITKALYGKLTNMDNAGLEENNFIDVRIPLQFLVQDNALLILNDQSKSNLEGFYDPCFGEKKKSLYIEYTFKGDEHRVTFSDTDLVRLPKTSHKTQWWSRSFSAVKRN